MGRDGKTANAVWTSFASSSMALALGNCWPSMSATVSTGFARGRQWAG